MKRSLIKLLSFLEEGQGISLGADSIMLDELSDKLCGFTKEDGEIKVITRDLAGGMPLSDLSKADLEYIFASDIPTNLENKLYEITEAVNV